MSKFPHIALHIGSLVCGTPVRDKAKGRSHLADHPQVAAMLAPLLAQISLADFDQRGNCARTFELVGVEFDTDVVEVPQGADCFFAFREGRGLGRAGTDTFSARPSRFVSGLTPGKTNRLKVVLWRKPADDEEDLVVVVTTCFPGDAAPEPWSYGLNATAFQEAKAYWETHAFAETAAHGLVRTEAEELYWQHNPAV